ncbi:unnamed protein product [Acanthoscelides obtectus]|uniref:Uncharacterized protein n=1 Tax=Acanthoscelides obtectus TaxID=200917 RepID=A0A9P0KF06_ACAOB|nr:unnamed protein product [Acanthoscelides obtectus]CAK1632506.1 hypothetical protein AOBTE_LOCUS7603 [Acanthoscelides obtectus]
MKWMHIITDYKLSAANKTIPKSDFPHLLKLVTDLLLESEKDNLISGFEKAGTYPLNRMKILERIPSNDNIDPCVQTNVSAAVIELLEERRFSGPAEQTTREKKLNITTGKSISIPNCQNEPVAGPSGVKQNILNRNKKLEQ